MKATSLALLALFSLVGFFLTERLGAEVKLPPASATPAELVKAALQTELDGPSTLRATLLSDALERDPNFAPARWQSGFVRLDGDWVKIDDVPQRATDDKRLTAYRKQRDEMVDTADNHRALARWCHKNQLLDEERVHWAKVMEFERGDAEALAALGLQLYDGRWLTRADRRGEAARWGSAASGTQVATANHKVAQRHRPRQCQGSRQGAGGLAFARRSGGHSRVGSGVYGQCRLGEIPGIESVVD